MDNEWGGQRKGAGRKPTPDHLKRMPVCYRLPKWLSNWLKDQQESQSVLIEKALLEQYSIKPPDK